MKINAQVETIKPQQAQDILDNWNYADNRRVSLPWVEHLARQMANGMWRVNGEGLVFDGKQNLLDGQHRLAAVVKYGKAVKFLVVRGVATDSFTTFDQGRNRSAGAIFGMTGEKHAHLLAAIARKVWSWEVLGTLAGKSKVSFGELGIVVSRYPEIRNAADVATQIVKTGPHVPVDGSTVGFCFWLFSKARPKKAASFFETLRTGLASYENDPAIVLRNRLYRERRDNRRRWGATELITIFVRAWNYYCKNEPVSKLAIKPGKDGSFKVPQVFGLGRGQHNKGSRTGVDDYVQEIESLGLTIQF